ncbi:hypothetical protein NDU88_010292 [Pleurodeles waltl]|uniref:Uncharacterized protein n=1 Tax=Pleurodeles waltl TaxID=8319 RepID=A0AAV7PXH4_PLEWA|nr:hypothetical protein NDU88_010292 [Pleurodeles waltl]
MARGSLPVPDSSFGAAGTCCVKLQEPSNGIRAARCCRRRPAGAVQVSAAGGVQREPSPAAGDELQELRCPVQQKRAMAALLWEPRCRTLPQDPCCRSRDAGAAVPGAAGECSSVLQPRRSVMAAGAPLSFRPLPPRSEQLVGQTLLRL